jgi:hypothetical protein
LLKNILIYKDEEFQNYKAANIINTFNVKEKAKIKSEKHDTTIFPLKNYRYTPENKPLDYYL